MFVVGQCKAVTFEVPVAQDGSYSVIIGGNTWLTSASTFVNKDGQRWSIGKRFLLSFLCFFLPSSLSSSCALLFAFFVFSASFSAFISLFFFSAFFFVSFPVFFYFTFFSFVAFVFLSAFFVCLLLCLLCLLRIY